MLKCLFKPLNYVGLVYSIVKLITTFNVKPFFINKLNVTDAQKL